MTRITSEVWGKGKNVRILTIFGDGQVRRFWTSRSEGMTVEHCLRAFGFVATAATFLGGANGTERWEKKPFESREEAEALIARFRKSAEKAGFRRVGRYREENGQYTSIVVEDEFKPFTRQFEDSLSRV